MKEIITGLAITALIPAAGLLINRIIKWLSETVRQEILQAEAAGQKVKASAFRSAQTVLEEITKLTVAKLESTRAADLREKVKAGEADKEDLKELAIDATYEILEQLKPEIISALKDFVQDLQLHVENQVEAVLPGIKAEQAQYKIWGTAFTLRAGGVVDEATVPFTMEDE